MSDKKHKTTMKLKNDICDIFCLVGNPCGHKKDKMDVDIIHDGPFGVGFSIQCPHKNPRKSKLTAPEIMKLSPFLL